MTTPLPTLLETSTTQRGDGGVKQPDTGNTQLAVDLYSCSGLTSSYTRSRVARLSVLAEKGASWSYHFFGGCGPALIEVEGGAPDLDTAVKDQWEAEVLKGTTLMYRGRIVDYRHHEDEDDGRIYTTLVCEGYVTRLQKILVTKTYTSGTVAAAVQDILDTYVTPNTRVAYAAADIQGSYTINSVQFNETPIDQAMNTLAMLQGSTEWGVTEGNPGPKFYFLAESTSAKEEMQAISGQKASLDTEGVFGEAYNTVKVVGGVSGSNVLGTATDATAAAAYGTIEKRILNCAIRSATDANRLATNWVSLFKDGTGRYRGVVQNPTARLERDRTGGTPFSATGYASFRGVDGVMARMPFSSVDYVYKKGSPYSFVAIVHGGIPEGCVQQQHATLSAKVENLTNAVRQVSLYGKTTVTDANHDVVVTANAHQLYQGTFSADRTITADTGGSAGQRLTYMFASDADVARTVTFSTNFKPTSTITSPATAGKYVSVSFESDGTTWNETGRQTVGV